MPDRHKSGLLGWHPPGELAQQARQEAQRRGIRLSALLTAALEAYLAQPADGERGQPGSKQAR